MTPGLCSFLQQFLELAPGNALIVEKYLVNLLAVGLGDQHRGGLLLGGSMLES